MGSYIVCRKAAEGVGIGGAVLEQRQDWGSDENARQVEAGVLFGVKT